jgi:hypothetical protein
MEPKILKKAETNSKKINLVDGEFTKTQALDVITSLIDQKINYHNIEGLQMWESNHHVDQNPIHKRIDALTKEKEDFKNLIISLKSKNVKLKINGTLTIELID